MEAIRNLAFVTLAAAMLTSPAATAIAIDPFYAGSYTATSLGSVPGLPAAYGGLTFLDDDTVLIGGDANTAAGRIYAVDIVRGGGGHVTGFAGTASLYSDNGSGAGIGEFNDGGVVFGPGGVLFTSRWPANALGQTKPGSTDEDKIIDLAALGVAGSHAAINLVPAAFGGAGGVKLVSWSGGQWYDADLGSDGSGTFDLLNLLQIDLDLTNPGIQNLPGGPEGLVYIAAGNPLFDLNTLLVAEFSASRVAAYDLDANGDPLLLTRRDFVVDLTGAEGATIDPITGDFLFSTFGGGDQVVRVEGFNQPVPIPAAAWLLASALGALGYTHRRTV